MHLEGPSPFIFNLQSAAEENTERVRNGLKTCGETPTGVCMATIDLPDNIERQLLALDRQVRDAVFGRGISRVALVAPLSLGLCLAIDWRLGLSGSWRLALLCGWALLFVAVAWRELLRPLRRPLSLPELAALAEREHPELKERLTSLVELRHEATPGTSPVMRDMLARQTAKVVDRLDLSDAAPAIRSPRTALLAAIACLLLLAPFAFAPADYGLLWARLFAPLGNFHWGSDELVVVDGDRIVAKGSDVRIRIEFKQARRFGAPVDTAQQVIWLHWADDAGVKDSRRFEWDSDSQQFVTTLPRVVRNLRFHAATAAARSESHRIDVANPPEIARLQLDIEPPAYTGLPAVALDGAQGEVRAAERSRIALKLQFTEPVAKAELTWPIVPERPDGSTTDRPVSECVIPIKLSNDRRSATVEALAVHSGGFAIHLKNDVGLTNDDPARALVVDPDLPPAISLNGTDEPVGVRPEDRHVVPSQIRDDYGLTVVELHLETSTGMNRVDRVPTEVLRERSLTHEFLLDIADFDLKPGQAITYRVRAVDNRPVPGPQETWTKLRTLMVESKTKTAPPEKELANREADVKQQIDELRKALAENKQGLDKLHRRTEDEALQRKNSDKTQELTKLEQQQQELTERLHKLAAELAENELTQKLADKVQQLADQELSDARERLEQAKQGEARDQLQPISEAIDRVASIDKQLKSLDQQLSELKRLEQDLAKLEQLARNTDRLAEKLEKLDQQARQADEPPAGEKPADVAANAQSTAAAERSAMDAERQKLQAEGEKLNDELTDLLKKHPELLDAARRDQLQRLEQLSEQAEALAKPQEQLAKAFEQAAADAPPSAAKPANESGMAAEELMPDSGAEQQAADAAQPANQPAGASPEQNALAQNTKPAPNENTPEGAPSNEGNRPEAKPAGPPAQRNPEEDNKPAQPSAQQQAEAAAAKAGAEAAKAQLQLAQQATRQAMKLAQQEGPESKATQAAAQFAKQAADAARQAQSGNLDQAAKQSQEAAQSGEETADQLSPKGQPPTPQSDQARQLAQRQQELSEQLKQMSGSKAAQQGAQQQGQQQLAEATASLSRQLEQAAQELGATPLDAKPAATAASKAQQAAAAAQQSMKKAADAAQANDAAGAAEQAANAAQQLHEAARQAGDHGANPRTGQSIPDGMAGKVTKAAQQLGEAQQQLKSSKTSSDQPANGDPAEGGKPDGAPQDEGLARAAQEFRQAADAMRKASKAAGPQTASKNPGSKSRGQGVPQQGPSEESPEERMAGPAGGGTPGQTDGTQVDVDLKQLDVELKKQAQRNWGKLPGQLRTEILQGASKTPRPEYAKQIKSYFEEIAKPATRAPSP